METNYASIPTGVRLVLQFFSQRLNVVTGLLYRLLMGSFFIEAYTLTNRPLSSYYAGLSFKSGYQQTGYVHPILSYGDVKYYYCLKLEARCLELGQVRLHTFVLFPRRYLCFYLTRGSYYNGSYLRSRNQYST